jgi:hypothetical protein
MITEGSILTVPKDNNEQLKDGDFWSGSIGYVFATGTIQKAEDDTLVVKVTRVRIIEDRS